MQFELFYILNNKDNNYIETKNNLYLKIPAQNLENV